MARIKPSYQVAQSDCGLACAHMLMQSKGVEASLRGMRVHYAPGRNGLTLLDLASVLEDYGLQTKAFKCSYTNLSRIPLPAIAAWAPKHYVVLEKRRRKRWLIIDPAGGRRWCSEDDVESSYRNFCLIAHRVGPRTQPFTPNDESAWYSIFNLLLNKLRLFLPLLVGVILVSGVTLLVPEITGQIVSRHQYFHSSALWGIIGGLVAGFFLVQLLNVVLTAIAATKIGQSLLEKIFQSLIEAPLSYFLIRPQGELLYRVSLVKTLETFVTTSLPRLVVSMVAGIACLIYISLVNTPSFAVLLCAAVFYALIFQISRTRINQISEELNADESLANSVLVDSITSIQVVKAGGHEKEIFETWREYNCHVFSHERRRSIFSGVVNAFVSSLQSFLPIVVFLVTFWGSSTEEALSNAVKLQLLATIFLAQITLVVELSSQFGETSAAVRRIDDIVSYKDEPIFAKQGSCEFNMPISIDGVHFQYGTFSGFVLKDISLTIPDKTRTALVGKTGCGKSTLAQVIAGLLRASSGTVRVGKVPIQEISQASFYRNVAYIPQDAPLRNASLRDNLTWGDYYSDDNLIKVLQSAQFDFDSVNFPQGLDTVLVNGGRNISGGQRQRIAVARALLSKPKLIILDEATSGLDQKTESDLYKVFVNLDCALVTITHRLEAVRDFDQIIVLRNGCVVESGKFSNLLDFEGELYSMFNAYRDLERKKNCDDHC